MRNDEKLWESEPILLHGRTMAVEGYEIGFEEVFLYRNLAIVHGLYDVIAFDRRPGTDMKDGKKQEQWRFRAPLGFEIRSAGLCGDILVLCGRSSTLAIFAKTGDIDWDAREVGEFQRLLVDFDTAREAGAVDTYLRINTSIRAAMRREIEQARAGTRQASREVGQSRREHRGERQEANVTGSARDYHQLRDDRRDLRDDRRDRDAAKSRADRMDAILSRSDALQPAVRDGNLDAIAENRRLMGEFLEVMHSELAATRTELGEDRRERREDRRERRTDRR
jgi:hypothetical protein